MRKILAAFSVMCLLASSAFAREPIQDSKAFKKYQNRSPSELSKLVFLLDRFNTPETEIQIEGNIYTSEEAFPFGKDYLKKNYSDEKAVDWLREHCYRTKGANEIIYVRLKGGEFRPFRDVMIEELENLNQIAVKK